MSQSGEENEVPQQEPVEEEKADNIKDAIKSVIKKSQANDGLVKGLNEVCKCLDRKQAILCILAEDCNDPKYKKLVDALAKASNVPLIEVEKRDDLGEWLGHCKYDADGAPGVGGELREGKAGLGAGRGTPSQRRGSAA